jgi:hypothetical protein
MRITALGAISALATVVAGASVAFAADLPVEPTCAELSQIQGKVLVDTGNGFEPVYSTVNLDPGDRIMVAGQGGALLTYLPSTDVELAANSTTTVAASCTPVAPISPWLVAGLVGTPVIITTTLILIDNDPDPSSP